MNAAAAGLRVDCDVPVPAADGVALMTDVYRPSDGAPRPCLLQRVAYDKSHPASLSGALDVLHAARSGYAVAVQDCRGRFASGGTFVPFENERDDTLASIRWAASQPWCDGRVCMFGRSYSALLQWLVADCGLPELHAIAPMLSGADLAAGWLAPQGAFEQGFVVLWSLRHLAPDMLARGDGGAGDRERLLTLLEDLDDVYRGPGPDVRDWIAGALPFLDALLDPARRDEQLARYSALSVDPGAASVPALVVAGWYDIFLEGCLESFAALPPGSRGLVVGPWPHGGANPGVFPEQAFGLAASADALGLTALQLGWFARWLEGDGGGPDPVHVFTMGENAWRRSGWPPTGGEERVLHLDGGHGTLNGAPPPSAAECPIGFDEGDPLPTVGGPTFLPGLEVAANAGPRDQSGLLGRDDAGVFLGDPLRGPLVVEGTVKAQLHANAPPPGMRFVARLLDVHPDGRAMLVCESGARAPGGDEPVSVRVGTTAYRFDAGHRIGLLVANSSFPRYGRGVCEGSPPEGRRGQVGLLTGGERRSTITLPLRPEEVQSAPDNGI
jgi:uncharacterized protein